MAGGGGVGGGGCTYQRHVPHAVVVHDILAGGSQASCHVEAGVAQAAEGCSQQGCGAQHQLPCHHPRVPVLHLHHHANVNTCLLLKQA